MSQYNPHIHHRRSIRLKGYDYSQAGLYFITVCCENREHRFGTVENGEMVLNDVGKITDECWLEIPNHFPNAVLHEHIVMPNHVHGIIELVNGDNVGTRDGVSINDISGDNVGTRDGVSDNDTSGDNNVWTRHGVSLPDNTGNIVGTCHGMSLPPPPSTHPPKQNQFGKPVAGSISVIVNQYKSSVKRWCNKNGHEYFKWQSRFYDHIIRNEQSYQTISEYIVTNPAKWKDDKFYTK